MTKTKTKTAKPEPTAAQWAALHAFAAAHGRTWKQALRDAWMSGDGRDAGELRQLRNQFGPSWLTRVDITKAPDLRSELVTVTLTVELVAIAQMDGEADSDYRDRVRETAARYVRQALAGDSRIYVHDTQA